MVVDTQRLAAAAAGDSEAMIEVILAEGQGVRLFIAAHVDVVSVVPGLEQAVWAAVRRQLPQREVAVPLAEWLRWLAADRIARYLQTVDPSSSDELVRLLVQECQAALADGRDQGAAGMASRLHATSADHRELLRLRYAEGEDLERLAVRSTCTGDAVASSLVAARVACDWRSGEPTLVGNKLLPRLLEDWFAGVLDPASRALLTEQIVRGATQATAIVRQVRLHTMLTVMHQTFGLREATALARQAAKQSDARDQASSYRGRGVPRTAAIDVRKAQRIASSPRTEMAPSAVTPALPLPLLVIGAVVLVGVLVLVVMNRDVSRPVEIAPPPPPAATAPVASTPTANQPPAAGSVLRPDFGGSSTTVISTDKALAMTWVGDVLQGSSYSGELLRLAVEVNRPDLIAAVDFHAGERLLATITKAPYAWDWREPVPFTGELSARAVAKEGAPLATIRTSLRILPVQGSGRILREWWTGSSGRTVAESIRATSGFPVRPKAATFETEFRAKRNWGDGYLQRMRGYIIPPVDGAYTFWIIGDDEAELLLSSDETSANLRRIALCPVTKEAAVPYDQWEARPQQRSEPVMLKAGRRYYTEARHKENSGSDHLLVGWQLPDGTMERPIPGNRLSPPDEVITPGLRGSRVFFTGFEEIAVGAPTPHFAINLDPTVPAANAVVMDGEAAEGRRFLRMNDAPGQRNEWTPEVCRSVDFTNGVVLRMGYALRVHQGCGVHYGWRHFTSDKNAVYGPRFSIDNNGMLIVGSRKLVQLPLGAWVRFAVTTGIGSRSTGTWALVVQPVHGPAQEFNDLECDPEFKRLHWVGFSSTQKGTGIIDVDAVSMHLLE